jgi:hypothetical protein
MLKTDHTTVLNAVVSGFGLDVPFRDMLQDPRSVLVSDIGQAQVRPGFGIHRIDEILSSSTLDPYVVALHDRAVEVDQRNIISAEIGDGQIIKRSLHDAPLRDAITNGLTLTINGVDRFDTTTRINREFLEYTAGATAGCNVYMSRSSMSPFDTHTDEHHVVAVQGEGRKKWMVLDPTTGEKVFDDWLCAGQSLFVPAHWPHRVHGSDEVSVHWTFGITVNTEPYRRLENVVTEAAKRPIDDARMELKAYLASDEVRSHGDLLRQRAGASLAYTLLDTAAIPLADISVKFRPRLPPVLGIYETSVLVVAGGAMWRVDRRLVPPLTTLSSGAPITGDVLAEQVGGKAARTFITWGVENGLLIAHIERSRR